MGYISTLEYTPDLVIFRDSLSEKNDILMTIAKIALTINIMLAIPLRMNPCRLQIYLLTKMEETKLNGCLITGIILLFSGGIAIIFPDIYAALTILGGSAGCMISLTIPGIKFV